MRRTPSLTLPFFVLTALLANCAAPSSSEDATNADTNESAATESVSDESVLDTREGLTALPEIAFATRAAGNGDLGAEAIAYATAAAQAAGTKSPEFKVTNIAKDADGRTHVRLQQLHQGIAVWGADQVVHFSDTSVVGAAGSLATNITLDNTVAALDPEVLLGRAKTDRFGASTVVTEQESTDKIVFVDAKGASHVAIHTAFYNELQGKHGPAFWNHVYDANTGALLARWNDVHTLEQASGPGGNPKFAHTWTNELDVEPRGDGFVMTTARTKTVNMNNGSSAQTEVVAPLAGFTDSVINDGHGYAEVTLNFLQDWFGRASINDNGFVIVSRVHYSRNYENAFWNGSVMTYGDGKNTFYPLTGGVDVISHEIHHGFTQFHSKLAYSNQAGAFNEGFSDIAGKSAEFYFKGTTNWDIGRDVFKADRALRYMCNPTQDGRSIDNAANMRPSTDPHYSSGVPNKAFCRLAKRISSGTPDGDATQAGVKRSAQAFFLANAQYWTSSTTFVQGCKGTVDAATALEWTADEITHLRASWADVGVTCP